MISPYPRIALVALLSGALSSTLPAQLGLRLPAANAATDFLFNRLLGAVELSDGSLIATDRNDNKVLRVRLDDTAPRELLRHGRGPGEYQNAGKVFATSGDSVLIVESFTGRWIVVHGDRAVGTISEGRPLNAEARGDIFGVARGGKVLGLKGRAWASGEGPQVLGNADTVALLIGDIGGSTSTEVARIAGPGRKGYAMLRNSGAGPRRVTMQNPLAVAD